jgi:asparagine synthase (glutamine-hydrolysing)
MCGFAGIIGQRDCINADTLGIMAKSLAHRGPDDQGIERVPISYEKGLSLALVHRRLSIIDLSNAAHQPMLDKQTGNWIVYNGEVYNYNEIRSDLERHGCVFSSHSDTETILKAFSVYGTDCLDKLRGMYAFAIWDRRHERLFFAVDRFGIKPLYFHQGANGQFIFASELRTILKSGLVPKKIDRLAVDSFLAYGAIQAPLTIIENVHALLPAEYMLYSVADRRTQVFKYWSPSNTNAAGRSTDRKRTIARTREILEDSIEKHLVSDVPVGLFLSGGIDSSATVIIANRLNKGQLRTFSVSFPESSYSEARYSRLIADRFCRNHTEISVSVEDLLGFLPDAIKAMDQPTIDGVNTYTISKAVAQAGIKVVLSGQGGDEVFGGYSTFRRVPMMLKARRLLGIFPGLLREQMARGFDSLIKRPAIGSKYSQILGSDTDVLSQYLILRQLFSPKARKYLAGEACNHDVVNGVPTRVVESLNNEMVGLDVFSRVSLLELRLYLANMLLRDGDIMSMSHSLEVRVPFLDHELVEFVFNVTSKMKLRNNLPKPLLVNAMGDLLPEQIYRRPKMGFTFPWEVWLRNGMRTQVEKAIYDFPDDNELGLNMKNCRSMWQMFLLNAPGVSWPRVWAIYVLLRWYNENIYSG